MSTPNDSTKSTSKDVCPACFKDGCVVFRNVPPVQADDIFEIDYRSLRAVTGKLERGHRIAVRNTVTNRLSYIDAFKLTKGLRRSEGFVRDAAPLMLSALKGLMVRIDSFVAVQRGSDGTATSVWTASFADDITEEFRQAERAIAKAEGR